MEALPAWGCGGRLPAGAPKPCLGELCGRLPVLLPFGTCLLSHLGAQFLSLPVVLQKARQTVAEVLHNEHPGFPARCLRHSETLFLDHL